VFSKLVWIPLVLLLIIGIGIGVFWYTGGLSQLGFIQVIREGFAPADEEVQIIIPVDIFAGEDIDEITARAVEVQGVEKIAPIEDDKLVYTMSPEVKAEMLDEAKHDLEQKLSYLEDDRLYPYLEDISYDDSYQDFNLMVDQLQDHSDEILTAASELFMKAVYYQYFKKDNEAVQEVTVVLEDSQSADQERFIYPDDLSRAAAFLESPAVAVEAPQTPLEGDKVVVDTAPDNLNLRAGPAITYLIIDILYPGTVLEVIGEEGEWLNVITPEQKEGWVHGDFVEIYTEED